MRAISTFSLECGTSTFWCRALMALRTRVKKSETGSVKLMRYISSNRRPLAFAQPALRQRFITARERTSRDGLPGYYLLLMLYQLDFMTPGISPFRAKP